MGWRSDRKVSIGAWSYEVVCTECSVYSGFIVVYHGIYTETYTKKDKETMLSANRDPIVLYPGLFYADLIQCDDSCVDPEKQAGMLYGVQSTVH